MSRFGIEVMTNGPAGETYKSLLVVYRCDTCGQLFDADFEDTHKGVHEMRAAFSETLDESNGIVTISKADFDVISEGLKEAQDTDENKNSEDEGEDG